MVADDPESFADLDGHQCPGCPELIDEVTESPGGQWILEHTVGLVVAGATAAYAESKCLFETAAHFIQANPIQDQFSPYEQYNLNKNTSDSKSGTGQDAATEGPTEAYDRQKHYGKTPTAADRQAVGGESVDPDPPLVKRYYEGDKARGEKPRRVSTTLRHMLMEFSEFFHVSWTGLLIHASVGTAGGLGAFRTKRSG